MKRSKFLVLFVTLVIVISCVGCYFAFAANDVAVTVTGTGNGTYSVSVNGNIATAYDGMVNKGDEVTLTATGEDFLYWIDGNKNTIKSATYTFTAEFDTSFEACFKPASGSMVVYRNTNLTQQILEKATYDPGKAFTAHLEEQANKYGFVFKGWSLTPAQIQEKINNHVSYIEVNPVYDAPEGYYAISVEGGTVNGIVTGSYANNELVKVQAEAVAGKTFCHWVDFNGNIVSDKESFELYAYKSDVFTAVYKNDCGKEHAPEVRLELYLANGVIHSRAQMFVPEGYNNTEYGLIYTKGETPSSLTFKLENVGGNVKKVSYTANATVLANHFDFVENASNQFVYACAYMKCNGETYYSNDGKASFIENLREEDNEDILNDIFGKWVIEEEAAKSYITYAGANMRYYAEQNEEFFNRLCNNYADMGYTLYGKVNEMGNLKSATYVSGNNMAHIYYSANEKKVTVVSSTSEGSNLPAYIESLGGNERISVTQLSAPGAYNGMGYVIKLSDGSFIVYDGGYKAEAAELWETLGGKSLASGEKVHIRAWIITHAHGDHYPAFTTIMGSYKDSIQLDRLMVSPIGQGVNKSVLDGMTETLNAVDGTSAKVCYVHTGMTFKYGNVTLEILYSPEETWIDEIPSNDPDNTTSVVSRIKVDGEKNMIFLGDANNISAPKLVTLYGDYLKSDMCQVAHHSCESFTLEAYKLINAKVWMVPACSCLYGNSTNYTSGKETGKVIYCPHKDSAGTSYTNGKTNKYLRNKEVIAWLESTVTNNGAKIYIRDVAGSNNTQYF